MRNAECENVAKPCETLERPRAANNDLTCGENSSFAICQSLRVTIYQEEEDEEEEEEFNVTCGQRNVFVENITHMRHRGITIYYLTISRRSELQQTF